MQDAQDGAQVDVPGGASSSWNRIAKLYANHCIRCRCVIHVGGNAICVRVRRFICFWFRLFGRVSVDPSFEVIVLFCY